MRRCGRLSVAILLAGVCASCEPTGLAPSPRSSSSAPSASTDGVDFETLRRQAEALASSHRIREALDLVESRAPMGEGAPWSDAESRLRARQAEWALVASRPQEALAILGRLSGPTAELPAVRETLARAALEAGSAQRALDTIDALAPSGRERLRVERGRALSALGRHPEALAVLAARLVSDPWHGDALLAFGRSLSRSGRSTLARPLLEAYAALEPVRRLEQQAVQHEFGGDLARAEWARGRAERVRGRLWEALERFREAVRRQPGLVAAWTELAQLSILLEQPDDAVRALRRLPQEGVVLDALADALEALGDLDAARKAREALVDEGGVLAERARARLELLRSPDPRAALARAEGEALHARRAEVGEQVRELPISESIEGLLPLVAAYRAAGRPDVARDLALFALRASPSSAGARDAVLAAFDRDADVFVRAWALRRVPSRDGAARFGAELRALGVDPPRVARELEAAEAQAAGAR